MNNEQTWVSSNIPQEVLDSRIFKFQVTLPSVFQSFCKPCNVLYPSIVPVCSRCQQEPSRVNRTIEVNLMPDVALNYDDVEKSLEDIPSQYAYWSAVYAETKLRVNQLERVAKTIKGRVYKELFELQREEKIKLNQDAMKIIHEEDPRILKAETELHIAVMQCSKLYYMVDALKMKADLARTLTSLKREEMNRS